MTISSHVHEQQIVADDVLNLPVAAAPGLDPAARWSIFPLASSIHVSSPSPRAEVKQEPSQTTSPRDPRRRANLWTSDEHERFLHGLELYPQGPWKLIAEVVGTRTTRQTMTHAQKYRQKIERHQRMNEAMGRLLNSVRSPLLFEGVTATKKSRARSVPSPATSSPSEATQNPPFDWNLAHDPEFHELLASLEPVVL